MIYPRKHVSATIYEKEGTHGVFCGDCCSCSLRPKERRQWLDGQYAPFGYIAQGWELFDQLQPNDVITDTVVDEWGILNLVKIRESRFADIVSQAGGEPGSIDDDEDEQEKGDNENNKSKE